MKPEDKIISRDDLPRIRQRHDTIAMCSGCFDVLQSGHAVFFGQCKDFADTLVIAMGRDCVISSLKGPSRPLNPEMNRAYLLAAMATVDYVILGESEVGPGKIDFGGIMRDLRPDVFVLNDDDGGINAKRQLCEALGVRLELVGRTVPAFLTPTSTTEIIEKSHFDAGMADTSSGTTNEGEAVK